MAVPFPEAQLEYIIYIVLGSLTTLVIVLYYHVRNLKKKIEEENIKSSDSKDNGEDTDVEIDKIGLSRRAEEVLNIVLDGPELQSELPNKLEISKATVSNSIKELKKRNLIKRKKKANTYLIEPKIEVIKDEQN